MKRIPSEIKNKASSLPAQPGVYLMKDSSGHIIYIGKASSLKKRVSSYFQKKEADPKTSVLIKNIHDIEFIVTDSEIEALILEATLIKRHRPRYNINLKDDKRYPYIAVTLSENYPRVILTRRLSKNGDRYFGPYTDARAARSAVYIVNSVFRLKECSKKLPLSAPARPCINFDMKRCSGPCRGNMPREDYMAIVEKAVQFLDGDIEPVARSLNLMMKEYSSRQEFEKAAQIRDIIYDIRKISEKQKVYTPIGMDQDFIGIAQNESEAVIVLFQFRSGVLLARKISIFENIRFSSNAEILKSFILNHYDNAPAPQRIITRYPAADRDLLTEHLKMKAGTRVRISNPATKTEKSIMNMLVKNIDIISADRSSAKNHAAKSMGLSELKEMLGLKRIPAIIECFDISNIQGKHPVASMVRFSNGVPEKSAYRRYKIKSYGSQNDPGMIHEAMARRMQYLLNEDLELPDIVVVDGGAAQLGRALEIKSALELDVAVIAIAKRLDEIYTEFSERPLRPDKTSAALKIIQNIRDEAHRFAIGYHKKLRNMEMNKSEIDSIPDIGTKKKNILLKKFKSVENIRNADIEELISAPGIGKKTAEEIYNHFHGKR